MGTIRKMVQYCMLRFQRKQMCPDELTQLGWGDKADYVHESNLKYSTAKLRVPVVTKLQKNKIVATPAETTIGELIESIVTIPG